MECSICFEPLGDRDKWDIYCVNNHAFHKTCMGEWVRRQARIVGFDQVKCPDCQVVIKHLNSKNPFATYLRAQQAARPLPPDDAVRPGARRAVPDQFVWDDLGDDEVQDAQPVAPPRARNPQPAEPAELAAIDPDEMLRRQWLEKYPPEEEERLLRLHLGPDEWEYPDPLNPDRPIPLFTGVMYALQYIFRYGREDYERRRDIAERAQRDSLRASELLHDLWARRGYRNIYDSKELAEYRLAEMNRDPGAWPVQNRQAL
jgi:hypothetical protein